MNKKNDKCHEIFQTFQNEHPALFQQPIVQSFLQEEAHYELLKQAICNPTDAYRDRVDDAFKLFYKNVRVLTYLSNLIYYNAINFDKTTQKHYDREMLTLDQPLQTSEGNEGATHKDMLYYPSLDMTDTVIRGTIANYVEDPKLYQAIQNLTLKQQKIITYKYVKGLQNKEIADLLGNSPQNISKLHQQTLKKLKKSLEKGEKYYDNN